MGRGRREGNWELINHKEPTDPRPWPVTNTEKQIGQDLGKGCLGQGKERRDVPRGKAVPWVWRIGVTALGPALWGALCFSVHVSCGGRQAGPGGVVRGSGGLVPAAGVGPTLTGWKRAVHFFFLLGIMGLGLSLWPRQPQPASPAPGVAHHRCRTGPQCPHAARTRPRQADPIHCLSPRIPPAQGAPSPLEQVPGTLHRPSPPSTGVPSPHQISPV